MIGWLHGTVKHRDPTSGVVLLDVGGVGYEVRVSLQTFAAVGEVGTELTLWVYTHVREDQLNLFGFADQVERTLFNMLIGVPKVGPKHAMSVLGGFPVSDLVQTLVRGDHAKLQKIPGIGRKTAEQVVLSLREKAEDFVSVLGDPTPVIDPDPSAASTETGEAMREEAQLVLVNLGWRSRQVDGALDKVLASDGWSETALAGATLDDLVRRTLAQLMER